MNLIKPNNSDLISLFNYVGKKFIHWKELDTNWGLEINGPLNFPVGNLYAKNYDQAGIEYWFYDGVLSYGAYVWYLLGGVCSTITIKKGKYIGDNFSFEENHNEFPPKLSMCSGLGFMWRLSVCETDMAARSLIIFFRRMKRAS